MELKIYERGDGNNGSFCLAMDQIKPYADDGIEILYGKSANRTRAQAKTLAVKIREFFKIEGVLKEIFRPNKNWKPSSYGYSHYDVFNDITIASIKKFQVIQDSVNIIRCTEAKESATLTVSIAFTNKDGDKYGHGFDMTLEDLIENKKIIDEKIHELQNF